MRKIGLFFREAVKNIRVNYLLNFAIVILIVSVMTFTGIICVQVKISGEKTEVVLDQEAFIEFSTYQIGATSDKFLKLLLRMDGNNQRTVPAEEAFLYGELTDDPDVNAKYLRNSDDFWVFFRRLRTIQGVYVETYKIHALTGQDYYEGHTVPKNGDELIVETDFFNLENLTFLKGRAPTDDDFYIDENGFQVVPVVVGYQLKDNFEIGDLVYNKKRIDEYSKASLFNKITRSYLYSIGKVVGVLDKSNSILHPSGDTFLLNVSSSVIKTWRFPTPDAFPELKSTDELYVKASHDTITSMSSMKIYINKTNEAQAVEEIRKALNETGLDEVFDVIRTNTSYAKISASIEKERADSYLTVAMCVGILCLAGLGTLIMMINVTNTKDYSIQSLIGASKRDLALMTTVQMIILLLVSDILIHYPYILSATGILLNGDSMRYIFATGSDFYRILAVINLVVIVLTYSISRIYTARIDIVTTIKDKE